MNETTEAKLRKVLDTKARLKTSINNKGGNITDDTPFDEYPTQVDNISSGANTSDATATANDILAGKTAYTANGKVEGTISTYNGENEGGVSISGDSAQIVQPEIIDTTVAIPNTGTINKICFNINLSNEEVVEIINNADLNFVDNKYYVVVTSGGETLTGEIHKVEDVVNGYMISMLGWVPLWISKELADNGNFVDYGWITQNKYESGILPANGIFPISEAVGVLPTHNGQAVGEQNEALKHLVYCDGAIYETGNMEVVKELSGQYLAETQTVTPEKTTTYNILDLIGEKVETKKEGTLLVSSPDTLVEKIYFNTDLSVDEVTNILSKLAYINNPAIFEAPFYIAYANADLSRCIAIIGASGMYAIAEGNFGTGDFIPIFSSMEEGDMAAGWNIQSKEYQIGLAGLNFVDMLQLAIGDQNDKLTSLISMNKDFEEVTTFKKVFPREINVNTKLFEEQINTLTSTNEQLTSTNEQLTSTNEQLTSTNEQLTSDLAEATKNTINNIIKGTGNLGIIEIPNATNIRPYLFYGWDIEGVTFSGSVQGNAIGEYAFSRSKIKTINIPDDARYIDKYAFKDCSYLYSVTFDYNEGIEFGAFSGCTSLKNISISIGTEKISGNPFTICTSLESIVVDKYNQYYDSRNNCNAIIETSTNKLITGCKNTVIPDSVTSIGNEAFYYCTGLKSITLSSGLTSIGDFAFWECTSLTSITIPDSVTSIGVEAFYYCTGLTSVILSNNITSIPDGVFRGCKKISNITIPNSVTSIGVNSFADCILLTNITIPAGVVSIGRDTRDEEGKLIGITNSNPFYGCESLESIVVDQFNQNYDSRNNCNAIIETSTNKLIAGCKNTVIPDSVTSIGESAFWGSKGLTSIIIPISVTSIGLVAFANCTSLTDIYYRGTQEQWDDINISDRNTTIGNATIHFNYQG